MNNCLGLKRYLALKVALCFTGIYHIGSINACFTHLNYYKLWKNSDMITFGVEFLTMQLKYATKM